MKYKRKFSLICLILAICLVIHTNTIWISINHAFSSTYQSVVRFDPIKHQLIFFHIEKTSGTHFDQQVVHHLLIKNKNDNEWRRACVKRDMQSVRVQKSLGLFGNGLGEKYACKLGIIKETWYLSRVIS
jgi:hypothetical protein